VKSTSAQLSRLLTSRRLLSSRPLTLLVLLSLICTTVSLLNPAFFSTQNLLDILVQSAPVIIVGCGLTLIILTGDIDISVGSLLGLLAAILGILASPQHLGLPTLFVIAAIPLAGAAIGLTTGAFVALGRIPSIIATLAMLTILRGVTDWTMGGEWITDLPPAIRSLGTDSLAGVPLCLWTAAMVTIASGLLLNRTRLGIRIRAIGGNPDAVTLAGASVARTRIIAFTLTGLLTGIATLVTVPQQSVIESGIGVGFELTVITAVVVGGTAIRGGTGGIAGTVIAAILLMSIRTALVFLDLGQSATYWERAIQGAFILTAVLIDHASRSRTVLRTQGARE
jgi:ribose/xylose/arabinose/galactoside ABC-type transport system permease subunit